MTQGISRRGFTLIEFLIYSGIFTLSIVGFVTILISVLRIQARQNSASEVNQQSQFLLQTIQYYIEQAVAINMPSNVASTTLTLIMASSTINPTYICLSTTTVGHPCYGSSSSSVYWKQGVGASAALTSAKVNVSNITFTKRSNPGGHDSVGVVMQMRYNSQSPNQQFSRTLETANGRMGPVIFSEGLFPVASSQFLHLGSATSGAFWRSINDMIYFNNASRTVGIGTQNPLQTLEVNGGLQLFPQCLSGPTCDTLPTCNAARRGRFYVTNEGGVDAWWACLKSGTTTPAYIWGKIF